MPPLRYSTFHAWLEQTFGQRVYKACIDAGFTCPNRDGTKSRGGCTFCDAAGSGAQHIRGELEIQQQVERQIAQVERRYGAKKLIAYFQAFTNTYAPPEELRRIYTAALCSERIVGLSVGTRSDCVSEEVCELLASFRPRWRVWLELGLQSANQATLDRVNRGERVEQFVQACGLARAAGLDVVAHVIFGLPGDTPSDYTQTIRLANACAANGIKIHNLYIDARSAMAQQWKQGEIAMLGKEDYVQAVCDALEILDPKVLVHRLTGEAPRQHHLAPLWVCDKAQVLNAISEELERRNSFQGSRFTP